MAFTRAVREKVFLKVAVTGPSGSGKTYSSLRLAFGLGRKIALLDTENRSGSLYAHLGEYDTSDIDAPFTHQKYIAAIDEAVQAGYDVLIIDSLTHAWAGEGGILDQKSARDARGGNSFTNWAEAGKGHELLKNKILSTPIHIIATMRSKQDYVIETAQGGKSAPRKIGMAPIQRDGMEYEFTLVLDCDMTHAALISKDRTGLFSDGTGQITEEYGTRLKTWLDGGAAPARHQKPPPPAEERSQAHHEARQQTYTETRPQGRPAPLDAPAQRLSPNPTPIGRSQGETEAARPWGLDTGQDAPAQPSGQAQCAVCGKALTPAQASLSLNKFGNALCPMHQRSPVPPAESRMAAESDRGADVLIEVEADEREDDGVPSGIKG